MSAGRITTSILKKIVTITFFRVHVPLLFLLVLLTVPVGGVLVVRKRPQLFGLAYGQATLNKEAEDLVRDVNKLIALPTDEKPTIATVAEPEKLKDEPFFKNSKKDDKVLVYTNAKKAILYRPSEHLIVEVGSVNIAQQPTVSGFATGSATQANQN